MTQPLMSHVFSSGIVDYVIKYLIIFRDNDQTIPHEFLKVFYSNAHFGKYFIQFVEDLGLSPLQLWVFLCSPLVLSLLHVLFVHILKRRLVAF